MDRQSSSAPTARFSGTRSSSSRSSSSSPPPPPAYPAASLEVLKPYFAGQPKSLSGIALRAFCLGATLSASLILTVALLLRGGDTPLWRPSFFLVALSVFHFLEFWTTAHRNTLVASIDSFLLTANWPSYAVAHTSALLECLVVGVFFPDRSWAPRGLAPLMVAAGLTMVVVGQVVRSVAMLQAGASFNHHVQTRKADSHYLVTSGVYAVLRHPSYFGFFYWGLGTQLVMGNVFCFVAYAVVLWTFFNDRIAREEVKLVEFFGGEYQMYRERVGTMIPFIQ
ncbi:farnesyl cysteine-carboxyl methyltransferase [Amphichorda felina]